VRRLRQAAVAAAVAAAGLHAISPPMPLPMITTSVSCDRSPVAAAGGGGSCTAAEQVAACLASCLWRPALACL